MVKNGKVPLLQRSFAGPGHCNVFQGQAFPAPIIPLTSQLVHLLQQCIGCVCCIHNSDGGNLMMWARSGLCNLTYEMSF